MCDPVTLGVMAASTAASVGGNVLSRKEATDNANNVSNARNAVLQDNLKRETAFGDQNADTLKGVIAKFDPGVQTGALDTAQSNRVATVNAVQKAPGTADVDGIPLMEGTPNLVKSQIAQRMLDAFQKSSDVAKARAKFAGYGDVAGANDRTIQAGGRNIDTVNDLAKGQAGVLGSEQDLAGASVNKPPSGLGAILSGAGQLGAAYAGAGAPGLGKVTSLFSQPLTIGTPPNGGWALPMQRA
jgi:hypothetical protein